MQNFVTEARAFLTRGRLIGMAVAVVLMAGLGVGAASLVRSSCSEGQIEVACPTDPVGPDGAPVTDHFYFAHQQLGRTGSITARIVSMSGTITYPPPNHDQIVSGLVPWAKAGIIIKDGFEQGSAYAALMLTGSHGVRMQHNYVHDRAGGAGTAPRWLRLTRSQEVIIGYESADGTQWSKVGEVVLRGLPDTVAVGLFAASPGDLTLVPVALGGSIAQSRFTQASAVFDNVSLEGATAGKWSHRAIGELNHTDWEKYHRAAGLVEQGGTLTVTGSGDIGPGGSAGGFTTEDTLLGVVFGLIAMMVVAVRYARTGGRAAIAGAAGVLCGLVGAALAVPLGMNMLRANGNPVIDTPVLTELRVIAGIAVLTGLAAAFAFGVGVLLRRTWLAILTVIGVVAVPYLVSAAPLLPDELARWLLRVTPAAGFAVQQTTEQYAHVVSHYAPSTGFFPLPWWAGLTVLAAYTTLALALATRRPRHRGVDWR